MAQLSLVDLSHSKLKIFYEETAVLKREVGPVIH